MSKSGNSTWQTGDTITAVKLNNIESALAPLYGDGSDGVFNSTGNVTFAVGADDGGPIVKQYSSFTLNAGHTMTVDRRCKGLIILCQGDVTISGTIHMDNLAARVSRDINTVPWSGSVAAVTYPDYTLKTLLNFLIPAGGAGGAGGGVSSGAAGANGGSNCAYGGSGGGGGGCGYSPPALNPTAGNVGAGTGGSGGTAYGASATNGSPGGVGGGGIIIIIAKGNITINAGGTVSANSTGNGGNGGTASASTCAGGGGGGAGNGGNGGNASQPANSYAQGGGGGGGAGGGVILLIYGGVYTNSGAVTVNGGSGGIGGTASGGAGGNYSGANGQAGQVGSIFTVKAVV